MSLILLAAAALGFADPGSIDRAVAAFVGPAASAAVQPVDRRLRLRPCTAALALSWRSPGHDAVLVQCPDASSWRLYVPVRAASGAAPRVIPVATGIDALPAITRGDAVTVLVAGDGFSVSRSGEALEPGAIGAWIKVRVTAAAGVPGDPLRAQVVRPGLVTIPIP